MVTLSRFTSFLTSDEDGGVTVPLSSSNLNSCSWKADEFHDGDIGVLTITFKGSRVYRYDRVPQDIFHGLVNATSPGGYFNSTIKNVYDVI